MKFQSRRFPHILISRDKRRRLQWQAQREKQPSKGYGTSPSNAIEDLRFRVDPDYERRFEKTPLKPKILLGNAFERDEIIAFNKRAFGEKLTKKQKKIVHRLGF